MNEIIYESTCECCNHEECAFCKYNRHVAFKNDSYNDMNEPVTDNEK